MLSAETRNILLKAIQKHDGDWGWYQFERAFPPGYLDKSGSVSVVDLLTILENDGLVEQVPAEPQARYKLTEKGRTVIATTS